MQTKDYTQANKIAWNEVAPIHAETNFAQQKKDFQKSGFSCLDATETKILQEINIENKSVAQLCCNNGRELLSIKNLGADHCVGFDISENFIEQAKQLAQTGNIDCEFVCTDVYDIDHKYDKKFDLVYITIGALCWLPDLEKFFEIVARILKPNGTIFIYDMHPILGMFLEHDQNNPPVLKSSYFRTQPFIDNEGLDYYNNEKYKSAPMYWFHYKLSDVMNACFKQNFVVTDFQEYEHDIAEIFKHYEKIDAKLPLCYTLVARKNNS